MAGINDWLRDEDAVTIDAEQRAVLAERRINRNPSVITLKRLGTPQTVRIEYSASPTLANSRFSTVSTDLAWVFGIKDHPELADTDIRKGDRFFWQGKNFQVMSLVLAPGEIQAACEETTSG